MYGKSCINANNNRVFIEFFMILFIATT
jgi:hypothetical protein